MSSAAPLGRDELLELLEDLSQTLASPTRTPAHPSNASATAQANDA